MISHDIATALRQFRRHKLTTAINFASLTLGLTCFVIAYGVHSFYAGTDSQFPDATHTYFVSQTFHMSDTGTATRLSALPWKTAALLRADFPELKYVARAGGSIATQAEVGGRRAPVRITGADADFLRIFPLTPVRGVIDSALDRPDSAVISTAEAERLFGSVDVVGRSLRLQEGITVTVAAVVALPQPPSHLDEDTLQVLVSMATYRQLFARINGEDQARVWFETWQMHGFRTYVQFAAYSPLDAPQLNRALVDFAGRHLPATRVKRVFKAEHISELTTPRMSAADGSLTYAALLLELAAIVLVIGCLNYSTLAAALMRSRMRELGMRRVIGAANWQLAQQQIVETGLAVGAAFTAACAVMWLLMPVFKAQLGIDLAPVLAQSRGFWAGSLAIMITVIVLAALYPVVTVSRRHPVAALRRAATSARSPFTTVLVSVQFAAAAFLLVGLLIISAQNRELLRVGLDTGADPVVVLSNSLKAAGIDPDTLQAELERQPHIEAVAFSALPPWSGSYSLSCCVARESSTANFSVLNTDVSADYFATLGMDVLAGRGFDAGAAADEFKGTAPLNRVIIDRGTAAALGWSTPEAAVGEQLFAPSDNDSAPRRYEIIGVVADRHLQTTGPASAVRMFWLRPASREVAYVRISSADVAAGLESIDTAWRSLAPNLPIRRQFLDEMFERSFQQLDRNAKIVAGLTAMAFAIAMAGLVAMALHITLARRKEIGVRKTLGATVHRLVFMLLGDLTKPIIIANLLAWPLAYLAAQKYLNLFVQRIDLSLAPFIASLGIALSVAWLGIAVQAFKAARAQPAGVLGSD